MAQITSVQLEKKRAVIPAQAGTHRLPSGLDLSSRQGTNDRASHRH